VIQSSSLYSLGLVKPTAYGVDIGLKLFGSKASNAFVSGAATTGVGLNLSIDLMQNFLGRKTKNDLKKSKYILERAELEKKISLKLIEVNLRKLYWSLVANNEQKILLSSLADLAKKQFNEVVRKNI